MTTPNDMWQEVQLGDLFQVKHGYAFKGEYFSEAGPYVVLTPGNFFDQGGFKNKGNKEKFYVGDVPRNYLLSESDLIVAMTEQAEGLLGSSALIPKSGYYLHNQRLGLITNLDEQRTDKHFLYYLFNTYQVRQQIRATANGAKVRHTSPSRIYEVKVSIPPLETQQQIAAILSAYDDLIENNSRRIKVLEEMAGLIYREWFVNFRFPGHEGVRRVASELGEIPEGWEAEKLADVAAYINRGIAPKYDEAAQNLVINQRCIRENRVNLESARGNIKKVPDEKRVQFGDVLINSTGVGTLGRVAQVYEDYPDCTVDSHVTIVRSGNALTTDYFGISLVGMQETFENLGVGSTGQTELSRQNIGNVDILVPPLDFQQKFSSIVEPMRKEIPLLITKNQNLRRTRDLLLPKLISGELDVSQLGADPEDVRDLTDLRAAKAVEGNSPRVVVGRAKARVGEGLTHERR